MFLNLTAIAFTAAALLSGPPASVASAHHHGVHCGSRQACITRVAERACLKSRTRDTWHCAIWSRAERRIAWTTPITPPGVDGIPGMTAFAWCVSKGESGNGVNISNGVDFGWFQFLPSTYATALAMIGPETASWDHDPLTAPVAQQTAAFNVYEPGHRLAWPITVPACGG